MAITGDSFRAERQEAWKARPPGEYDTGDVPRFLKALESDDRLERSNAAEALSEIRPVLPVVVPALLVALGDSDAGYNSAQGLASISLLDGSIVPSLVEILQSAEGKAPYWAVVALEEIGWENDTTAIPAVITALVEEKEGGLRIAAAKAVAGAGPVAVDAVPRLVKIASGEEDSWDCKCAVIALGRIGPQAAAALPLLTRMFDSRHEYRIDVARALWRIDPSQAARLVPELVVELEGELSPGKDGSITNEFLSAVELLGQIGSEAQAAVPVLKENLWGWRRFDVAWALWRIDPGQLDMVMPVFADCLYCFAPPEGDRITRLGEEPWNKYPNERSFKFPFTTRVAAFGALWQIHPDRRGAMAPLLIALLREWGQQKVLKRLEAETRSAIPALEDLIGSEPQRDIGLLAREALRKIKTTDPGRW